MITAYKVSLTLLAEKREPLDIPVIKAEIMETMYRGSRYRVELISKDTSLWNSVATAAGKQQILGVLKWGMNRGGGDAWCKTPRTFVVTQFRIHSEQNTVHVTITGHDGMFLLKNRAPRVVFKKKTLDAVVKDIAQRSGLDYEGSSPGRQFDLLMQCGRSDYDFLTQEVLARSGPTPYVLYCKNGNVLVFKPRKPGKPAYSIGYGTTGDIAVSSMLSVIGIDDSNYGVSVVGFDAVKRDANALTAEYVANDETKPYEPFGGAKPKPLSDVPARIQNIACNEPLLKIEDVLKQRVDFDPPFGMCRSYTRTAVLLDPELGDCVEVRAKTTLKADLFFTGNHQLYALYHYICPGQDCYTYLFLERRGIAEAS